MPTVQQQLRREQAGEDAEARRQQALDKRRRRAARRAEAPTREVHHRIPEAERICPACGGDDLKPLGQGRTTVVYEYVPARFEKQVHVQETLACACGKGVVTAPAPPKVVDRGEYGPGFMAHVVGSKGADSMPLHRLAQRLERGGVPMSRSTLTDLFHLAAEVLSPVSVRLLQHIARAEVVWADETPLRVLDVKKTSLGYLWTFLTGVVRTLAHRALRQNKSRPVLDALHAYLTEQQSLHLPKGPMGQAISYALNQWEALCRFVEDERLPLDNNRSEGALRKVELGRENFLFVGHEAAGENLAGLYALVATCEANGINPETYLADVLLRV